MKFKARQADINRGWGKYYSKSCKAKHQEARTGQYRAYLSKTWSDDTLPQEDSEYTGQGWG